VNEGTVNRVGCYPGSFNPATIAHIAVAEAAWQQCGLDRVDLVLSRITLGKESIEGPTVDDRAETLRTLLIPRPWLGVVVTDAQLLSDIAAGYEVLVMGADKWAQINESQWYESDTARETALAALPKIAVALRPPHEPPSHAMVLQTSRQLWGVSSTGVRSGSTHWKATE
jgi:nicotinic acid mononucleotide adenylyltransferase